MHIPLLLPLLLPGLSGVLCFLSGRARHQLCQSAHRKHQSVKCFLGKSSLLATSMKGSYLHCSHLSICCHLQQQASSKTRVYPSRVCFSTMVSLCLTWAFAAPAVVPAAAAAAAAMTCRQGQSGIAFSNFL
jgi:hypothetical protein